MENLRKRTKTILVIFTLWFFLATIYLFYFTVYSRTEYIKSSNQMLFREGRIPAGRGSIFDKNGKKLAWSERTYDLCLEHEVAPHKRKKDLANQLKKIFPNIRNLSQIQYKGKMIIKKALTPKELTSLQKLLHSHPELIIRPELKRVTVNVPQVKEYIGKAVFVNNTWEGVSGVEKEYNSHLNGTDGLYTVMLDKSGRWIKGSSIRKREMIPGKDLFLKKSADEIIQESRQPQMSNLK